VSAAKWIPLSAITTNEDGSKYKLFPNAFQFVKLIKQWLLMNGKVSSGDSQPQSSPQVTKAKVSEMSVTDVIKLQTPAHRSQVGFDSRAQKERIWNFYMPYSIDSQVQEKL